MKTTKYLTFLPILLLTVVFAFGQNVRYNYAPGTNFSAYKTYQWGELPGPGGKVPDQLIDQAIQRAVNEQLAQKGLNRVEKDGDLMVGYHAILREEKNINLNGYGGGAWGGGWGYGGLSSVTGQTSTIPVGMLLVDIYDPGTKQLIWRGDASKTIDLKKDPNKNYSNLQKAMTKLFKNYPPPAK
jgi:hypothetical protein